MACKWQVEIDPYCQRVLAKHWPNVRRWDDVKTFPPATNYHTYSEEMNQQARSGLPFWPDVKRECYEQWRVDVICGGFPCQDISYAGYGEGIHGKRSGLFFEAIRIIRALEPRFVVLENVAALLDRGMGDVLGTLAAIGMDAEWECIPASAIGQYHDRDRVFVCAYPPRAQYRGCSQNRVNARDHNGNLEDWLALRLLPNGQVRGLKVNLTWLRWFMGFPTDWGVTDLEKGSETQCAPT